MVSIESNGIKFVVLNKREGLHKTSSWDESSFEDQLASEIWEEDDVLSKNVSKQDYGIDDLGRWSKKSSYGDRVGWWNFFWQV